jgi:carbonic anhydrase
VTVVGYVGDLRTVGRSEHPGVADGSGVATNCGSIFETTIMSAIVHDPDRAIEALKAGNARFADGHPLNQSRDSARRAELTRSHSPFAVVLSCSDSRVVPEIVFDQGLGDLFCIRVAGNTAATPNLVGSIEYGVTVLGSVLLVVLGHEDCGAVKLALANVTRGDAVPEGAECLLEPILPAARKVATLPSERQLDAAIRINVEMQLAGLLSGSTILQSAVSDGKLRTVGARYELMSGRVELL